MKVKSVWQDCVCLALQGLLVAILYCFVNKEVGLMDASAPSS